MTQTWLMSLVKLIMGLSVMKVLFSYSEVDLTPWNGFTTIIRHGIPHIRSDTSDYQSIDTFLKTADPESRLLESGRFQVFSPVKLKTMKTNNFEKEEHVGTTASNFSENSLRHASTVESKPQKESEFHLSISKVLIVSLARSGSSMLGTLVSTLKDRTFYYFEPLSGVTRAKLPSRAKIALLDRLFKPLLRDSFTCNFMDKQTERYNWNLWTEHRFLKDTLGSYTEAGIPLINSTNLSGGDIGNRQLRTDVCQKSQFKVVKIIRAERLNPQKQRELFEDMLREFPDLLLLGLIRDPRANWFSRRHLEEFRMFTLPDICDKTFQLHETIAGLKNSIYSKRVKLLKYEDIATHPGTAMRRVAELIGTPFRRETQNWIDDNMSCHDNSHHGGYTVTNHCPEESLNLWKKARRKPAVGQGCRSNMQAMGYV